MICEQCKQEGKTSNVYIGGSSTTDMAIDTYYDEDGKYHMHDPNSIYTGYTCSNGHSWGVSRERPCITCERKKEAQ